MRLRIVEKSRGLWTEANYASLMYYLLVVILGGLICSYLLGAIFCQLVFGISFFSSSQVVFSPENSAVINAMKAMQFFNAVGTFIVPPIVFMHLRGISFLAHLKLNKKLNLKTTLLVVVMAVAMIPAANFLGALNESIPLPEFLNFLKAAEEQTLKITEQFLQMDTLGDLFYMLFLMALVAAVGEEFLFRGVLQNLFQNWSGSKHVAIWLTALLFSVIHLQYHAILPRFILGAFIGYLYVESGNLKSSILLHFTYNATLVVMSYMIQHHSLSESWEIVGTNSVVLMLASVLVFIGGMKLLPKMS